MNPDTASVPYEPSDALKKILSGVKTAQKELGHSLQNAGEGDDVFEILRECARKLDAQNKSMSPSLKEEAKVYARSLTEKIEEHKKAINALETEMLSVRQICPHDFDSEKCTLCGMPADGD